MGTNITSITVISMQFAAWGLHIDLVTCHCCTCGVDSILCDETLDQFTPSMFGSNVNGVVFFLLSIINQEGSSLHAACMLTIIYNLYSLYRLSAYHHRCIWINMVLFNQEADHFCVSIGCSKMDRLISSLTNKS